MINYLKGDATRPVSKPAIIVHVCNNKGGWGKGFVLALSAKWKEPEDAYRDWHKQEFKVESYFPSWNFHFELGNVQLVRVEKGVWVANMIAQDDYKRRGDLEKKVYLKYTSLKAALTRVAHFAMGIPGVSIHMPRIGCGLAGGTWDKVEEIILSCSLPEVFVYDFE